MNHPNQPQDQPAEEAKWDPESAYNKSGSFRLIAFILLVLVFGAAALFLARGKQEDPGFIDLDPSMTFEQADRKMLDSGYDPESEIYRFGTMQYRYYCNGPAVFRFVPASTALEHVDDKDGGGLGLIHSFAESGDTSYDHPGEVFLTLKDRLTGALGEPDAHTDGREPFLYWVVNDHVSALLGYMAESVPTLYYHYAGR